MSSQIISIDYIFLQIQPDLITLDPGFVGSLAPPSKLTETTFDGKPSVEIPYSRLSRLERLKVSGKADETEETDGENAGDKPVKISKEEREKRKLRGKGKSLSRYLRKQRKNVIDPTAVSNCSFLTIIVVLIINSWRFVPN